MKETALTQNSNGIRGALVGFIVSFSLAILLVPPVSSALHPAFDPDAQRTKVSRNSAVASTGIHARSLDKDPGVKIAQDMIRYLDNFPEDQDPSLNLSEWNLSYPGTLEALELLLAELGHQRGIGKAEAIGWLAECLIRGEDKESLVALAGEGIVNDALFLEILDYFDESGAHGATEFKRAALAHFAIQDPAGGISWLEKFHQTHTEKSGELGSPLLSSLVLGYSEMVVERLEDKDSKVAIPVMHELLDSDYGRNITRAHSRQVKAVMPDSMGFSRARLSRLT